MSQAADMSERYYDIVIVGAGCAGMTAALYARRLGKSVLLLEKDAFGGQIAFSPKVENYPGFSSISGMEFADRLFSQAIGLGAYAELETVSGITPENGGYLVSTDYGEYSCAAVIISAGLKHRSLGLERESELVGKGISYCAVCDGAFYRERRVAVCGGGNTALQDALFLSDVCESVDIIHRRDKFRGDDALIERLRSRENVTLHLNCIVKALHGEDKLNSLSLADTQTGESSKLVCDALFVAIGLEPQTSLLEGLLPRDKKGYFTADESCETPLAGVFVAGDCRAKEVRQLTTAAGDGAVAAIAACRYIDEAKFTV